MILLIIIMTIISPNPGQKTRPSINVLINKKKLVI